MRISHLCHELLEGTKREEVLPEDNQINGGSIASIRDILAASLIASMIAHMTA
jgi:hypothetical protein